MSFHGDTIDDYAAAVRNKQITLQPKIPEKL